LADAVPGIELGTTPSVTYEPWWELATRFRLARFYLRFLQPEYQGTPALLRRARVRAPRLAVKLGESIGRNRIARRLLVRALEVLETATRASDRFHDYLTTVRPDLLVSTPLVVLKTAQLDLAQAATELGVRNVFAVASWDHLSSKGELTGCPQHVLVWNEIQKQEAISLHGVPEERITVTGAQVFDEWFGRQPSTTREAFCARVGLRADRPLLLYVCSSLLEGSPAEAPFVLRWARHLRASGHPSLRECGILVRPHFKRGKEWGDVPFDGLDNIVCWPPAGDVPVDAASKADYFDSLFHASAVVGLNTSAMIEAGILGRPVFTVLLPEFHADQRGTVHFHYLLDGPDALLRASDSLDAHANDVAGVLRGDDPEPERDARFVRTFVRPGNVDRPATANVVDALERIAALPAPPRARVPSWIPWIRPLLAPFAAAAAARARRVDEEFRHGKHEALLEHRRRKAEAARTKRARPDPPAVPVE
jgi:hypothetical protein